MVERGMGARREVGDELAPANKSAWSTLGTLLLVAAAPWAMLALTAWTVSLMGI